MSLTNLKTVKKTVTMTGVTLVVPADRIGLGFGAGQAAYPAGVLSQGQFPVPHNPEPEQLWSRQDQSAAPMRKQTRTDGTDVPDAVPPASSAGCRNPGSSADRVAWSLAGLQGPGRATDPGRSFNPVSAVRNRLGSDCHSLARFDGKPSLPRKTAPATAAGK